MSENKYRDYLSDDRTFYRQYLKSEDEPVGSSSFTKVIMGAAATVGLAAGTAAAYRHGAFKGAAEKLIDNMAQFRTTRLGNTLDSVRNWTKDDMWDDIAEMDSRLDRIYARAGMFNELPNYLAKGGAARTARQMETARNPIIQDKPFELVSYIRQMESTLSKQRKEAESITDLTRRMELNRFHNASEDVMLDAMKKVNAFNKEQQANLAKRTGYSHATVNDVWNHLPPEVRGQLQDFENKLRNKQAGFSIMDKVVDQNILIKRGSGQPQFADLRDFRDAIAKTGDSLAEDFTTPFIKINPLRMFYLNEFTKNDVPRLFANMGSSKVQPYLNSNLPINDSLFVNGKMHTFNHQTGQFDVFDKPGYLVNARNEGQGSLLARNTKNMMNLYNQEFTRPSGMRGIWHDIAKFMDFGFQNERIGQDPTLGDVAVYGSWIGKKLHDGFGPWGGIKPYADKTTIESPFGNGAEWLFIPRYKTLKEVNEAGGGSKDYFKQFFAARNNPDDVSTASFFAYTFAERLNATLNQMGFGLSAKHLGSAQQILWQLSLRRALPVAGVIEGYKASNHLWEQATGDEYEDQFWGAFTESQMDMARAAESMGMTNWAKEMVQTMPGIEFLSELPIPVLTSEGMTPMQLKHLMPLDKTEEELRDYYQNGEDAVRKGRYWETGNTPLTGSKVDYYQPNWYKRITSDWEYTENMWGSKAEYWKYHPKMPLLDPYHWEKKHYEDRPYQLTGGIPMIEEFPLIGPVLNATVGQILKPQQVMHEEEWNNPGYYKEKLGFQLAESFGLLETTMGGATAGGVLSAHTGSASVGVAQAAATTQAVYGTKAQYNPAAGPSGVMKGQNLAYVTSSGNISVMKVTKDANLYNVNQMLQSSGIGKTGVASEIRMQYPELSNAESEALANPAGVNMALGNFHYNMTEMGGFYGWMSTFATGRAEGQYDPRIQTSSKAYGFNRQFWDSDYGNMGADAMEIFRRFVPRDAHKNYVNTIDNNMPTWLPGPEYFTDFQHGDPYVKVKKGEMRLPGQAYERLYGIDGDKAMELEIGASLIGYGPEKMIQHWLRRDDVKDAGFQDVLDRGTDWHKAWEAEMRDRNITISDEEYVKDEESGIGGFYDVYADHNKAMQWMLENAVEFNYYRATPDGSGSEEYKGFYSAPTDLMQMDATTRQAILNDLLSKSKHTLLDPKTRSDQKFETGKMQFENTQQVNFYASKMGTGVNYLVHADADNPEKGIKIQAFEYSPELLDYTKSQVNVARQAVYQMMEDGAIGRGDLYGPVDRYRILADVAPYSEEFRKLKAQLSLIDLNPEEKQEIQEINDQVSSRKEHVRTYDYRFKTADVKNMTVTIKEVIDNNTFLTEEFSDNPIRLAGVYVPTGQDEKGQAATEFVRQYLRKGNKLTIGINADDQNLVNNDTYSTISAVVRAGDIKNLNRELIQRGLAKEKESDWSATGVHARFSDGQIAFGSAWESFAHMDTPFHTKLLQVRSPYEQYVRREVYGKDWQDWGDPVDDFFVPWYQNWISKSPVAAITLGTFMGSLFGSNRYGRVMGAMIGGTASALGVGYTNALGAATGEKWIPERRRKEREVEEYFDILKYVKYRGLYEQAADEALKREGFNVRAYMKRNQMSGDARKTRLHQLKEQKRKLMRGDHAGFGVTMEEINAEINELTNNRKVEKITPIAAEAIQYYQESERTMYAYDPGDPLQNILSALPRKDRLYFNKFLEAPEEEREKILAVVPGYVKRALQSMWGMKADPKPDLYQYFAHHNLPGAGWEGWDPRANLSDIKLRVVKREGMDMSEFNMWPEDEKRAGMIQDDQVPQMIQESHVGVVKNKLRSLLGEAGFRNLNVEVEATRDAGIQMDINVAKDRRQEIQQQLNENGYSLI